MYYSSSFWFNWPVPSIILLIKLERANNRDIGMYVLKKRNLYKITQSDGMFPRIIGLVLLRGRNPVSSLSLFEA